MCVWMTQHHLVFHVHLTRSNTDVMWLSLKSLKLGQKNAIFSKSDFFGGTYCALQRKQRRAWMRRTSQWTAASQGEKGRVLNQFLFLTIPLTTFALVLGDLSAIQSAHNCHVETRILSTHGLKYWHEKRNNERRKITAVRAPEISNEDRKMAATHE